MISAQASGQQVATPWLIGQRITKLLTAALDDSALIGWLKVVTGSGGFAARPSETEEVDMLHAESFKDIEQPGGLQEEAQAVVRRPPRRARQAGRCPAAIRP